MKRRPLGSLIQRPPRPGYYVTFMWGGRRIKRSAGPTKAAARKKLAAAEAPLYLEYAQGRKKESTLRGDVPRLRVLCRSGWSGKFLSQTRPVDFHPWIAERQKSQEVTKEERVRGADGKMRRTSR
jgi:hypothetical protein